MFGFIISLSFNRKKAFCVINYAYIFITNNPDIVLILNYNKYENKLIYLIEMTVWTY